MHHSSSQIHQHMPPCPGLLPSEGQLAQAPLEIFFSPCRNSFTQQKDHYDQMAHMGPGRRLKTSQSAGYLNKPSPLPSSDLTFMPQMSSPAGPGAILSSGRPINIFSRKAGTRYKYVDVPNPSKPANSGLAPNPADSFVHLAPMSMPANLFVPCSGPCQQSPDDQQPLEGSEGGNPEQNSPNATIAPWMFNPTLLPPAPKVPAVSDGSKSGEIRQHGYVNLWRSLHHATTKILRVGASTATMCRSLFYVNQS